MNAVERGIQLATTPMKDVPLLAREFLVHLTNQVGACSETCITAFAVYAQCVEGLPCNDSLYTARPQDRDWFATRGVTFPAPPTLTDEERDVLDRLAHDAASRGMQWTERVVRGLLDRLK